MCKKKHRHRLRIRGERRRLRRFGHLMRRKKTEAVRMVMEMHVEGSKGRGSPKK